MNDVRLELEGLTCLQSGLRKKGKALGVIGVVALSRGIKGIALEVRLMLNEEDWDSGGELCAPNRPLFGLAPFPESARRARSSDNGA